jgi:hypothetical protein
MVARGSWFFMTRLDRCGDEQCKRANAEARLVLADMGVPKEAQPVL